MYFIYGMYECLNLVCEPDGVAGGVLIRAIEPLAGIEEMQRRRPAARRLRDLASGPGKLTIAMGITREHDGRDMTRGDLQVRELAGAAPAGNRYHHAHRDCRQSGPSAAVLYQRQ